MLPMALIQVDHKQMFQKFIQNSDRKRQKFDSSYSTTTNFSGANIGVKRNYGQHDRGSKSV